MLYICVNSGGHKEKYRPSKELEHTICGTKNMKLIRDELAEHDAENTQIW